jgi:hypothetical protein
MQRCDIHRASEQRREFPLECRMGDVCGPGRKLNEKIDVTLIPRFVTSDRSKDMDILYPESFCKGENLITFHCKDLIQVHSSSPHTMNKIKWGYECVDETEANVKRAENP